VSAVVLDEVESGLGVPDARSLNLPACLRNLNAVPGAGCVSAPGGRPKSRPYQLGTEIRPGVAGDGDVVWLDVFEARLRCLNRKARPMLDSIETFLFNGGCEAAVF